MWSRSRHIPFALRLTLSLSILATLLTACSHFDEPDSVTDDHFANDNEMVIYVTDSTEWVVRTFATGQLYADAVHVELSAPWLLPTREDAQILKTLTYESSERFITCDGYTFGMPSASVTKAGAKTKYSVLGLWKRPTVIDVPF